MYGDDVSVLSTSLSGLTNAVFSGNASWDGEKYILDNTTAEEKNYTCLNSETSCTKVQYVVYNNGKKIYYIVLENGEDYKDVLKRAFKNENSSQIKISVDSWYMKNMTNYTSKLEDTVWCNDRNFVLGTLTKNNSSSSQANYTSAYNRNMIDYNPSLTCMKYDSFTTSKENGNGALEYPVGLLTADELTLAGNGSKGFVYNSYLDIDTYYWTMSPAGYVGDAQIFAFYATSASGRILKHNYAKSNTRGVRPAISLKAGTDYVSGTGTVNDPYIVE
jgi:hypothetical protein